MAEPARGSTTMPLPANALHARQATTSILAWPSSRDQTVLEGELEAAIKSL